MSLLPNPSPYLQSKLKGFIKILNPAQVDGQLWYVQEPTGKQTANNQQQTTKAAPGDGNIPQLKGYLNPLQPNLENNKDIIV